MIENKKELKPEEIPEFQDSLDFFKAEQMKMWKTAFDVFLSKGDVYVYDWKAAADDLYEKYLIKDLSAQKTKGLFEKLKEAESALRSIEQYSDSGEMKRIAGEILSKLKI